MATISENLRFLIEADTSGAVKTFEQVGKTADRELGRAQSRIDATGAKLTSFGAKAVAAGGVAGAALFGAAKSFEHLAIEAGKFSDATGVAVEDASRWIEVAGDMGVEAAALETSLGKFNKTIATSPDKVAALGVELQRTADGTVDVNATFLAAIDTINGIEDPTKRAKAAAELFGRGWQGMAELIATGSGSLRESLAAVSDAKVINEDELARAKAFRESMDALSDAGQELAISIGQGAAPVIGTLADLAAGAGAAIGGLNAVSGGAVGQIAAVGATALIAGGGISFATGKVIALKGALATMNPYAAGATAAIAGAVQIYQLYSAEKARAKARTDAFVQALKAERAGQEDATEQTVAALVAGKEWAAMSRDSGIAATDFARYIMGESVPAVDAWIAKLKDGGDYHGIFQDTLENTRAQFAAAVKEEEAAAGVTKVLTDRLKDTGGAAEGATPKLKAIGDKFLYVAGAAADTAEGIAKAYGEWDILIGKLDREQALDNLTDGLDELEKLGKEAWDATSKGAKDAAEKQEAYNEKLLQSKLDVAGFGKSIEGLPPDKVTDIIALIDQGKLREAVMLLADLSKPRTVPIKPVLTGGIKIPGAIYGPNGNIIGWGGGGGGSTPPGVPEGATGGIVTKPTVALIGEAGPEAVIPLSQAPGASPLPAGMGAAQPASYTFNIMSNDPDRVVEAIKKYVRRNGPLVGVTA